MTDCGNDAMRDLLPLLAHDALEPAEAARVRAHLVGCASCAAELELVAGARALFAAATPPLDVEAIRRRLPMTPSPSGPRVARPARSFFAMPRYALAAAASLILVATLSLTLLRPIFFGAGSGGVDVAALDSGAVSVTRVPVSLLGASDLNDLSADELTLLLDELDQMEATIADEPFTMRAPLTQLPEGI